MFDKFNASLLTKSINFFFKKTLLTPHFRIVFYKQFNIQYVGKSLS